MRSILESAAPGPIWKGPQLGQDSRGSLFQVIMPEVASPKQQETSLSFYMSTYHLAYSVSQISPHV